MSYSKSKDAAKEFLKWWFTDEQFGAFFKAQAGYWTPAVKKWNDDPIWTSDPKLTILREASKYGRFPGWQAPPGDGPAQTLSKYIIVDMFAQAVSSGNVKGAIQNAETQMKQIYSS